jgi:biotin-(acetyl-CoA carboxylase) ligase
VGGLCSGSANVRDAPRFDHAAWRSRDALLGQPVRWQNGSGKGVGIDEGGALLVDTDSGVVALDAGEVHLLR